jgi:hypothetical protein
MSYVKADLTRSRSFDLFAIASSSTELGSHSMLGYPFSIGPCETMLRYGRIDSKLQQNYVYNRQESCSIGPILQSYALSECLFEFPNSIEIQFFEEEGSSQLVEGDVHILERIKELVENGRVLDARHILSFIPYEISDRVDNWRRVLAKPKASSEKSATGVDPEKTLCGSEITLTNTRANG